MRKLKKKKNSKRVEGGQEGDRQTRHGRQRGDKNGRNVRDPQSLQHPGETSLINEATDV